MIFFFLPFLTIWHSFFLLFYGSQQISQYNFPPSANHIVLHAPEYVFVLSKGPFSHVHVLGADEALALSANCV